MVCSKQSQNIGTDKFHTSVSILHLWNKHPWKVTDFSFNFDVCTLLLLSRVSVYTHTAIEYAFAPKMLLTSPKDHLTAGRSQH